MLKVDEAQRKAAKTLAMRITGQRYKLALQLTIIAISKTPIEVIISGILRNKKQRFFTITESKSYRLRSDKKGHLTFSTLSRQTYDTP